MWSPEEEHFASQFLRIVQFNKPTVLHEAGQLNHLETQIGKVQAGFTGDGDPQGYQYDVSKQIGLMKFGERRTVRCDKQFLQGMITTARYLRRNIR